MSLRVVVTLFMTFIGSISSFFDSFYGLLTYAFWSYTYPETATWGFIPIKGLSYMVGIIVVSTTVIQRKRIFSKNPVNFLIIAFWFLCLISVYASGPTELAQWQFKFFTRVILITLIITVLVDDPKRFRYYLWAIAIFIGLIAAQSGVRGTLAGQIGGASKGFEGLVGERNFMAVMLCITIPIVFYMLLTERRKWLKFILLIAVFGDILALVLTYSRGGFLGFMGLVVFALAKARHKIPALIVGGFLVFILVNYFIPQAYIDRVATITQTDMEEQDKSAKGRLVAWRSAIEMIKDKPITGVGFYNSEEMMENYPDPKTGVTVPGKAIHNALLKVGAEVGLPALFLYIAIYYMVYRMLGAIKRKVKAHGLAGEISAYASMLQTAFVGFFVSGMFINSCFIDMPWHLAGLTMALAQITNNEISKKNV